MKKLQTGRSMIEMLGVLAIIGVLSIGGLAGYTMAMNRHRANQILDYMSRCAIAAQTRGDGYEIVPGAATMPCTDLLPGQVPPNGISGTVAHANANAATFMITSSAIASADIRTALRDRSNTNVTITDCPNNENALNFVFQK